MKERFTFTFLRNPIERVLSLYYFCRNQDSNQFPIYKLAHELDLNDFLRSGVNGTNDRIKAHIWNNQVWQLAYGYGIGGAMSEIVHMNMNEDKMLTLAIEHSTIFSFIGFTETFNADCKMILSSLGIPVINEVPRANVTKNRSPSKDLSLESKRLLQELTWLDQKLYNYLLARKPKP